ncbi:hypothetical protein N7445_004961 [Penicillium cf. griseofulvum]|nr:hypothetical protein N7445_004961 [Penicillium cf. griseofulvum]
MAKSTRQAWRLLMRHSLTHPSEEASQYAKIYQLLANFLDNLQVAIDVSGNGQLPWPASTEPDSPTLFHDITLFLTSESHNFTISNGTNPTSNTSYVGPVLDLEPSSTVKHVNWIWPECLVGDGSDSEDSARGAYNISMHQSFRWNGTDYYTVFDLPISVTNSIPEGDRIDCDLLENKLLSAAEIGESSDSLPGQPWVEGGAAVSSPDSTGTGNQGHSGFKRVAGLAIVTMAILHFLG